MDRATRILAVAVLGVIAAVCVLVPQPAIALGGSLLLVLGIPGWVAAHALAGGDSEADRADLVAAAFGGVAVSATALWITGATIGFTRVTLGAAPVVASLLLTLFGPSRGDSRRTFPKQFRALAVLSIVFAILVAVPFVPYGLERADGVHHMGLSDWYLHLMMTTTLDTAPSLPPDNPYLLAHHAAYYHYAFHLIAAAIHRIADRPVDIFPLLLGLTMLTAAAFPLVVFSLARRRAGGDGRVALLAAGGATLLAGFDVLVWATYAYENAAANGPLGLDLKSLRLLIPSAHLHAWIPVYERQFNAPYVALLWAPHYVAAVLTALLAIHAMRSEVRRPAFLTVAFLLAALPGLSAYVLVATAVAVAAIVAADVLVHRNPWRSPQLRHWMVAGIPALLLALPIFATLRASVGQHVAPLILHVSSVGTIRNGALFTTLYGDGQSMRLADTPMLLLMQFGVLGAFGVIGILRRLALRRMDDLAFAHAAAAVAVLVFLVLFRPPIGMDNNLGMRPMLLVWGLLAPFAAEAWALSPRVPLVRWIALLPCLAALPYGLAGATLEGYLFRPTPKSLVEAARWINEHAPPGSPVAVDPENHPRNLDLWLRQPLIEAEHRRNAFMMGAPPDEFEAVRTRLHEAYGMSDGAQAGTRFVELGADVVLASRAAGGPLPWATLSCFVPGYQAPDLVAYVRAPGACPRAAAS